MSGVANMGLECDMEESGEELLIDQPQASAQNSGNRRAWGVVAGLIVMCAAATLLHNQTGFLKANSATMIGLVEKEEMLADADCEHLPFVNITKVKSSNLGKQGPDKDAPEGIIYEAHAINTGANVSKFEVHVHSLKDFDVEEESNTSYDATYDPAFKSGDYVNGIYGKFAVINIKQNTSLKLRLHAYDAEKKEDFAMPHGAISFFDLDTGKDNNHSVEHVKIDHFKAYYLSNETEVKAEHEGDFASFYATKEGTGDDNPSDPMELTKLQKNRAVTIEFENIKFFNWEIGASAGATGRVFTFVFRPSLLCAKTKIHKHYFPPTGEHAPIVPVVTEGEKSNTFKTMPSLPYAFGVMATLAYCLM